MFFDENPLSDDAIDEIVKTAKLATNTPASTPLDMDHLLFMHSAFQEVVPLNPPKDFVRKLTDKMPARSSMKGITLKILTPEFFAQTYYTATMIYDLCFTSRLQDHIDTGLVKMMEDNPIQAIMFLTTSNILGESPFASGVPDDTFVAITYDAKADLVEFMRVKSDTAKSHPMANKLFH